MTPGPKGEALCKGFETCVLHAYLPTPNDRPTIGWGETGPDIQLGMVWTQAQADNSFHARWTALGAAVDHLVAGHPTTQDQFDAMCSFAWNEGIHALATSTLLRKHNAGDFQGAADEFPRWNKQGVQVLRGLVRRRAAERSLYLGSAA